MRFLVVSKYISILYRLYKNIKSNLSFYNNMIAYLSILASKCDTAPANTGADSIL